MPVPKGAIREVLIVLAGSIAVALVVSCTWYATHSKQYTVVAGLGALGLAYVMDKQRAYRRRMRMYLPVHIPVNVRWPGSTAL